MHRLRRDGQGEVELRAVAEFALSPEAATVSLEDVLDDGEAEAGAAGFAGAGLVNAVKPLEDAMEVFRGDAGAKILHSEFNLGVEHASADADALAAFSVFE